MQRLSLFIFLFCKLILTQAQIDKGLVGNFTFNNGQVINEVTQAKAKAVGVLFVDDRFGNDKSACYLHGSQGSYLNLGTSQALKPVNGSISLWVNIDIAMQAGKGYQFNPIILTKNLQKDDFYEAYTITYDFIVKKIVVATSQSEKLQVVLNSEDTIALRQWHHVVITYDFDYLTLYIDGAETASISKKFHTLFSPTDSVMIGNSANAKNERFLCGAVDDVRIYNRVLKSEEVAELFHMPNPNRSKNVLRWLAIILGILVFITALVGVVIRIIKTKLDKEAQKNALNARMNDLETKAIRMQMNPHFIFNSLNTLQRFILEEDFENAQSYLTRFSKLLRTMLESNTSEAISLEEEMEIIRAFVEIEKLRFGNTIEFQLQSNVANPKNVMIPFMLIQPFIENAIWHGLLMQKNNPTLKMELLCVDKDKILCRIDDNGVGRASARITNQPVKKKSLALDFIKQRLELIEKSKGISCYFKIIDKMDSEGKSLGTCIELLIPIIN